MAFGDKYTTYAERREDCRVKITAWAADEIWVYRSDCLCGEGATLPDPHDCKCGKRFWLLEGRFDTLEKAKKAIGL